MGDDVMRATHGRIHGRLLIGEAYASARLEAYMYASAGLEVYASAGLEAYASDRLEAYANAGLEAYASAGLWHALDPSAPHLITVEPDVLERLGELLEGERAALILVIQLKDACDEGQGEGQLAINSTLR